MSAEPLTRDAAYDMFKEIVGKAAGEIQERGNENTKKMIEELRADLEAKGHGRIIDQIRANGGDRAGEAVDLGRAVGQFVRVTAAGKMRGTAPVNIAKEWSKKDRSFENVVRALEAQDASTGGLLVPEPVLAGVIDLLRAQVVVQASGASMVPMPSGNLSMNYQATSSTANYQGERATIPLSNPTLGRLKLNAKKLAARVIVSNDLLRFASTSADAFVRDDLVKTIGVRMDLAFIRDDGSSSTPKGIRWLTQPANVTDRTLDTGAVTLATVTNDLAGRASVLEMGNIPMRRPGWLMSPRTKWFLYRLRDGLGNQVFREEMAGGTIFGYPFRVTTNIPTNLGAAGDESEVYLVDFDSVVIGEATGLELAASDLGDGFPTDDTHVRAIIEHDINMRYRGAESAILTAVDWI